MTTLQLLHMYIATRGTARYAMLANSCYVSWGTGVTTVSNSK